VLHGPVVPRASTQAHPNTVTGVLHAGKALYPCPEAHMRKLAITVPLGLALTQHAEISAGRSGQTAHLRPTASKPMRSRSNQRVGNSSPCRRPRLLEEKAMRKLQAIAGAAILAAAASVIPVGAHAMTLETVAPHCSARDAYCTAYIEGVVLAAQYATFAGSPPHGMMVCIPLNTSLVPFWNEILAQVNQFSSQHPEPETQTHEAAPFVWAIASTVLPCERRPAAAPMPGLTEPATPLAPATPQRALRARRT
jgi:hypothetical protein